MFLQLLGQEQFVQDLRCFTYQLEREIILKYLTENPVFVVNLPSLDLVKATDYCGVKSGVKYNKIKDMNLTIADSENINCGYIENCPINIECSVTEVKELGKS